jgi:hypothetical protein
MAGKRKRAAAGAMTPTAADMEAGMVLALHGGDALLGWAKAPQDPWWPCIATRSLAPLGLFDEIDPVDLQLPLDLETGAVPKGKVCAFFLGEESCCLVDNGFFDAGVRAKKPHQKPMEERPEYAEGVRLADRLQARLDVLEEGRELYALRLAVQAGKGLVVEAVAATAPAAAAVKEEEEEGGHATAAVPPQLLRPSWPAVAFTDWEVRDGNGKGWFRSVRWGV